MKRFELFALFGLRSLAICSIAPSGATPENRPSR